MTARSPSEVKVAPASGPLVTTNQNRGTLVWDGVPPSSGWVALKAARRAARASPPVRCGPAPLEAMAGMLTEVPGLGTRHDLAGNVAVSASCRGIAGGLLTATRGVRTSP